MCDMWPDWERGIVCPSQKPANQLLLRRELCRNRHPSLHNAIQSHSSLLRRLKCNAVLEGHRGCVNRLAWNEDGSLLASGSDDLNLLIWDYASSQLRAKISSGHTRNIFGVSFLPNRNNGLLVSGAMDSETRLHSLLPDGSQLGVVVFRGHNDRVKDVCVSPDDPNLFWSASEDGTIREYDVRAIKSQSQRTDGSTNVAESYSGNILISLGTRASASERVLRAMAIHINPSNTLKLAVGCGDNIARIYDRRMLKYQEGVSQQHSNERPAQPETTLCPQPLIDGSGRAAFAHITSVQFSLDGSELLTSYHDDSIYLFNLKTESGNYYSDPSTAARPRACVRRADALKKQGNIDFVAGDLSTSVAHYSEAIALMGSATTPALLTNRALVLLKRKWKGDAFEAERDCRRALHIDDNNKKARYRLIKALAQQDKGSEAASEAEIYKIKFGEEVDFETKKRHEKSKSARTNRRKESAESCSTEGESRTSQASTGDGEQSDDHPRSSDEIIDDASEHHNDVKITHYSQRYVGHCNVQTDIKEAKFVGRDCSHIASGSDDGRMFIWDKKSGALVNSILADSDVVNCVQSHPLDTVIATSGIENVIRLWSPTDDSPARNLVEESEESDIEDSRTFHQVMQENQDRMRQGARIRISQIALPQLLFDLAGRDQEGNCTQS